MKKLLLFVVMAMLSVGVQAQRVTDKLNRGLVAMKVTGGVYCSWRIPAEEYYDVTYNLYRDGVKVASALTTSNYTDAGGSLSSVYTVSAVVRGVEQPQCAGVKAFESGTNYKEIRFTHEGIKSTLRPNDACCADVDGDGELEILMKFDNLSEAAQHYPKEGATVGGVVTGEYAIFECLKMDGTRLWWVNCGPNMGDFQNNEQNIVAFDWDQDGKAEALFRAADGTTIHAADGQTYVVGDPSKNYRVTSGYSGQWFMHEGAEYLVYVNGLTGVPYVITEYPLKRLEAGETSLERAWGDGYGHRSTKHFFGAPYLDGRHPSIFLARGIYTRHKFVALDVDPATHQISERWRWTCNVASSPWYGNGFHNYAVADVDMDGRDEICFGSMVIDDNGMGLSTTALRHGDAQHHGDFDPYTWGLEIFTCLEEGPVYGNALRDGTTGKIYYKYNASNDDGRAIMGNFTNLYPGAIGTSSRDPGVLSAVTHGILPGVSKSNMAQNFRIYWDGDLLEETFNYTDGKNTAGGIYKHGRGLIAELTGSMTNNDTKGTACYQGDLFGDWREEVIMRTADENIRIYTTNIATPWRNYTLWHDHQYRNAMVWQMCGYNQPPHTSYFLGELEQITMAPPPLTTVGRQEIANGGTITTTDAIVTTCETGDMTVNVAAGATPYIYIDNAPSWVQGSAPSEATLKEYKITYQYYTHTLQGGGFAGATRVVKQGDGILQYPALDMTYTGTTDVWAGTLQLNGSIAQSPLWLNRHTTLLTPEGKSVVVKSLTADYGSTTNIGGKDAIGQLTATDSLRLGFGSRLLIDVYADGLKADGISTGRLVVETKDWTYGPTYKQPVVEFNCHFAEGETTLTPGDYVLGTVGTVVGNLSDIKVEGISKVKATLVLEGSTLKLHIEGTRDAADIEWNGNESSLWDVANTENFATHDPSRATETFIEGDNVYLTDDAQTTTVNIPEGVEVKPSALYYTASKDYTVGGQGSIAAGTFYSNGSGTITMAAENSYTGGNHLTGGTTVVTSLANTVKATGNLGGRTTNAALFTIENGAILRNTAAVENGSAMRMVGNGIIDTRAAFTQQGSITGDTLIKRGSATLKVSGTLMTARTIVNEGTLNYNVDNQSYARPMELYGNVTVSGKSLAGTHFLVHEDAKATLTLTGTSYINYSGTLTGTGQLTVNPTNTVSRVAITGNWNNFEGTVVYNNTSITMPLKNSGMAKATLQTGANTNIGIAASSNSASVTYPIGRLTGSGTLRHKEMDFSSSNGVSGNVTWQVGNTDLGDFTFEGSVYDAGGNNKANFEKVGQCAMTVSGNWQNSGTVKVSEGRLIVRQGASLGKGALTIGENGTLMGYSALARSASESRPFTNSSVTVNGALRVGMNEGATGGYWYFDAHPLTIGATGTLHVGISKSMTSVNTPGCTHYWGNATTGAITFDDGATVSVTLSDNYDPAASIGTDEAKADSFCVFSFPKVTMGQVNFVLPALPDHYYWDTTKFATGYLYIRYGSPDGIMTMSNDAPVSVEVISPRGIVVRRLHTTRGRALGDASKTGLPAGTYIVRICSGRTAETVKVVLK